MNKSQCLELNNKKIFEKKENPRYSGKGDRVLQTVMPLNDRVQDFDLVGRVHAEVPQV